jgi:low temperature requirement protein LtrA
MAASRTHERRRFSGRDPEEANRASTPLELLYDLTIVVAFGTAADQLADFLAEGHVAAGIGGFAIAAFAVSWAWLNYSWFASAYDTDDWVFRLATMVQMGGVIVNALGIPALFASLEHGGAPDLDVMVGGYVVMRVSLSFLWWQVSRHDPVRRGAALTYMRNIIVAQAGWVLLAVLNLQLVPSLVMIALLIALEVTGPWVAEHKAATPWNAEHIAERYSLLVIITLGEVILGTVAALNAVVHGEAGWSADAVMLAVAGVGLAFGCWWVYFAVPWASPLEAHRGRAFPFGYLHLLIFAPLAAMGAGLRVAAFDLEGKAEIGDVGTVLSVAIPVAIFLAVFYLCYSIVMHEYDPFHLWLLAATSAVLVIGVVLAAAGVDVTICLLVLAGAPATTVVGYETIGHRHIDAALERL